MKDVVNVGSVKVKRTLYVSQHVKGKSLERFIHSDAFKKEVSKDSRIIAQNSQKAQTILSNQKSETMAQSTRTQKQTSVPAATKKASKKAAPKKAAAKKAAPKKAAKEGGPGKIEQILALHAQGLSNKEIIEKGFNKTTVSIQVAKFKKEKAAAKEVKAAKK